MKRYETLQRIKLDVAYRKYDGGKSDSPISKRSSQNNTWQNVFVLVVCLVTLGCAMLVDVTMAQDNSIDTAVYLIVAIGLFDFVVGIMVVNYDLRVLESRGDTVGGVFVKEIHAAPWSLVVLTLYPFSVFVAMVYIMILLTGKDYV